MIATNEYEKQYWDTMKSTRPEEYLESFKEDYISMYVVSYHDDVYEKFKDRISELADRVYESKKSRLEAFHLDMIAEAQGDLESTLSLFREKFGMYGSESVARIVEDCSREFNKLCSDMDQEESVRAREFYMSVVPEELEVFENMMSELSGLGMMGSSGIIQFTQMLNQRRDEIARTLSSCRSKITKRRTRFMKKERTRAQIKRFMKTLNKSRRGYNRRIIEDTRRMFLDISEAIKVHVAELKAEQVECRLQSMSVSV